MKKEKVLTIIDEEIKVFEDMEGHQSKRRYSPYAVAIFLKRLKDKIKLKK